MAIRKVSVMNPPARSVEELVHASSLIFTGAVVERGTSTVPAVPPNENLVVVRLERALRVDPVLGDLRGKMITVAANTPESLSPDQKAVFFTNSWVHGRGIAVREVEHVDIREEASVATAVAQLPQIHLGDRLKRAELVVDAEVVRISPVERKSFERNAALWVVAELKVDRALQGKPSESTMVYFPTSDHPLWARAPRFKERQRGIFILHAPSPNATPSEATLEAGSLVALDPADFQPESQLAGMKKLLAALKREGSVQ
jgi:hypothetical protein